MQEKMTTKELSEYLRVHERTLLRWRKDNQGPKYFKTIEKGRVRIYYCLKNIKTWEESCVRIPEEGADGKSSA